MQARDIHTAVSELSLSGAISLGRCSTRTLYRWAKDINEYLEREHAEWRVKAIPEDNSIIVV